MSALNLLPINGSAVTPPASLSLSAPPTLGDASGGGVGVTLTSEGKGRASFSELLSHVHVANQVDATNTAPQHSDQNPSVIELAAIGNVNDPLSAVVETSTGQSNQTLLPFATQELAVEPKPPVAPVVSSNAEDALESLVEIEPESGFNEAIDIAVSPDSATEIAVEPEVEIDNANFVAIPEAIESVGEEFDVSLVSSPESERLSSAYIAAETVVSVGSVSTPLNAAGRQSNRRSTPAGEQFATRPEVGSALNRSGASATTPAPVESEATDTNLVSNTVNRQVDGRVANEDVSLPSATPSDASPFQAVASAAQSASPDGKPLPQTEVQRDGRATSSPVALTATQTRLEAAPRPVAPQVAEVSVSAQEATESTNVVQPESVETAAVGRRNNRAEAPLLSGRVADDTFASTQAGSYVAPAPDDRGEEPLVRPSLNSLSAVAEEVAVPSPVRVNASNVIGNQQVVAEEFTPELSPPPVPPTQATVPLPIDLQFETQASAPTLAGELAEPQAQVSIANTDTLQSPPELISAGVVTNGVVSEADGAQAVAEIEVADIEEASDSEPAVLGYRQASSQAGATGAVRLSHAPSNTPMAAVPPVDPVTQQANVLPQEDLTNGIELEEAPVAAWEPTQPVATQTTEAEPITKILSPTSAENQIASQIVTESIWVPEAGEGEFRLRLDPPHLGEVRVRLVKTKAGLRAEITAVSESTETLLAAKVEQLEANLRQAGIDVAEITVEQGLADDASDSLFAEHREHREQSSHRLNTSRYQAHETTDSEKTIVGASDRRLDLTL